MRHRFVTLVPCLFVASCVTRNFDESQTEQTTSAKDYRQLLDTVGERFKGAPFAHFKNHSSTLYVLEDLYKKGTLAKNPKRTIVHFDYHSDLYRDNQHTGGTITIGNYINTMVADRDVSEVWWIVPDATRSDPVQRGFFWDRQNRFSDWQFRDGPADQYICVGADKTFTYGVDPSCGGKRPVKFHKRTLGDVVAAADAKIPGPTILDIDADFFDYNGNYANDYVGSAEPRLYRYNPKNEAELNANFAKVLTAIEKMDLRPDYIAAADSPEYTASWANQIAVFLDMIGAKAHGAPATSHACSPQTYDARICPNAQTFPVYNQAGKQIGTANAGEPVCKTGKTAGDRVSAYFLFDPPGEAFLPAAKLCDCDLEKLRACINGGGEDFKVGECRSRYCK